MSGVIEAARAVSEHISEKYDITANQLQEIKDASNDRFNEICLAYMYGFYRGQEAAEQADGYRAMVNRILKRLDNEEIRMAYYMLAGMTAGR